MGNCLFGGGMGDGDDALEGGDHHESTQSEVVVQVATWNGGIMEFQPPIIAGSIMKEFPGHLIFRSDDLFWKPLPHHQDLVPGISYCVLRCNERPQVVGLGQHVRSKSIPMAAAMTGSSNGSKPPYRMSFERKGVLKRSSTEVVSRFSNNNKKNKNSISSSSGSGGGCGVWKVKLVISPEQLVEILSKENRTQELIDNVTTVARCGRASAGAGAGSGANATTTSNIGSRASSMDFSDQWSQSS